MHVFCLRATTSRLSTSDVTLTQGSGERLGGRVTINYR